MTAVSSTLERLRFAARERGVAVWDLKRGWPRLPRSRRFDQAQLLVLGECFASPNVFLSFGEDPNESDPGHWERVNEHFWQSVSEVDIPALQDDLLFYGGWSLCCCESAAPETPCPDCFSASTDELLTYTSGHRIQLLIQSFWDDREWVVVDNLMKQPNKPVHLTAASGRR